MNVVKRSYQQGLSLVELMVAMVLGLLISLGVIQIFDSNRVSYRTQEALSRVQESGRIAISLLSREIRIAGFWGCHGNAANVNNQLNPDPAQGFDPVFHDFANGGLAGADNIAGNPANQIVNGTDGITVRRAGALNGGTRVIPPYMAAVTDDINVPNAPNDIENRDYLVVSDCLAADVFRNRSAVAGQLRHTVGGAGGGPGNLSGNLSKVYGENAMVYRALATTFFIRTNPVGEPALYMSELGGVPMELVEGIEDMQILYGEDATGDGSTIQYFSAGDPALDMARVVSVRVSLLVRSTENATTEPQVYTFNGVQTVAPDLRLRKVYTTTIALRN